MKQNLKNLFLLIFISGAFLACQEVPDNLTEDKSVLMSRGNSQRAQGNEFGAFLTGAEEVTTDGKGVDAQGAGAASFVLSPDGKSINYILNISKIKDVLFAHIHLGAIGENGPVVVTLIPSFDTDPGQFKNYRYEATIIDWDLVGPLKGKEVEDLVKMMEMGMAYVNVHTAEYPGGELRGQISVVRPNENGNFTTQLSGDQEVPSADTQARGVGIFKYNQDNSALAFKLNVAQLQDVRFAHVHLGKKGVNGPVVATLRGDRINGRVNGVYATGNITKDDLQGLLDGGIIDILREAMRTGNAYVNVHTDRFPAGELRGQL